MTRKEKRKFERLDFGSKINVSIIKNGKGELSSERFEAIGKNIGLGGICFSSDKKLALGTMLEMEIFLLPQSESVHIKGKVRWCIASEAKFDTGVQFLNIGKEHVTLLVKYVCGNLCKDVLENFDTETTEE